MGFRFINESCEGQTYGRGDEPMFWACGVDVCWDEEDVIPFLMSALAYAEFDGGMSRDCNTGTCGAFLMGKTISSHAV